MRIIDHRNGKSGQFVILRESFMCLEFLEICNIFIGEFLNESLCFLLSYRNGKNGQFVILRESFMSLQFLEICNIFRRVFLNES